MTYRDKTEEQLIQELEMLRTRVAELEAIETERTQVGEALVREQYLMRALMDNVPDHIYFKDAASRFIRISKSQSDRFGLSDPAQAVGKTDFDFFTEEHARPAYEDEQSIIRTGQPMAQEELETWPGQPDTWVLTTKLALRDEAGNIVGTFGISKEITERKRAEEALKDSQERYCTLFEHSPVSLWEEDFSAAKTYIDRLRGAGVQDLRNYFEDHPEAVKQCVDMIRVVDVNKAALEWYHVANKEELQGNLSRLLSPEGYEDIKEELMGLVEGGTRYELASARQDQAGNPVHLIVTGTVVPGHEDSWGRVLVSILDITELKRIEEALRESEARYRAVIESQVDLISRYLPDTTLTFVNDAYCQFYGKTREELIGHSYLFMIVPEFRELVRKETENLAKDPRPTMGEYLNYRQDGKECWIQWVVQCIVDKNGQVVELQAVGRDITERKRAEEALRERESTLNSILRAAPTGIGLVSNRVLLKVNLRVCEMVGRTQEELIGKNARILYPTDAEYEYVGSEKYRQIAEQGIGTVETHWQHKNGAVIDVLMSSVPLDPKDLSAGVTFTALDITERKRAEEALRQYADENAQLYREVQGYAGELEQRVEKRTAELSAANVELARASRAKDEFLSGMSHELRTPLTAILGLSEVLQEQVFGPLNEKQAKYVQTIGESGRHLLSLITDILDLSKIEAGKAELEIGPVAIDAVCEASLQFIKQTALKKQLKVCSTVDQQVTLIQADERRLKQILVNLLSNAVKFTPAGGQVGLEVVGDVERVRVDFTVWDTGIGIAPEDMGRLFQSFVQLDSSLSRQYMGTGLGLALVRQLTDLHGGSVSVESQVGQGSRFTVSLPWHEIRGRARVNKGQVGQAAEKPGPPVSMSSGHLVTILLAEDNETNLGVMSDFVSAMGYRVIVARDGHDAIRRATEEKPEVILMDIQMPGLDGLEAIRRIRTDAGLVKTPIIALTALTMPGDRERCLEAGANDYLSKPVGLRNLLSAIEAQLAHYEREE